MRAASAAAGAASAAACRAARASFFALDVDEDAAAAVWAFFCVRFTVEDKAAVDASICMRSLFYLGTFHNTESSPYPICISAPFLSSEAGTTKAKNPFSPESSEPNGFVMLGESASPFCR